MDHILATGATERPGAHLCGVLRQHAPQFGAGAAHACPAQHPARYKLRHTRPVGERALQRQPPRKRCQRLCGKGGWGRCSGDWSLANPSRAYTALCLERTHNQGPSFPPLPKPSTTAHPVVILSQRLVAGVEEQLVVDVLGVAHRRALALQRQEPVQVCMRQGEYIARHEATATAPTCLAATPTPHGG